MAFVPAGYYDCEDEEDFDFGNNFSTGQYDDTPEGVPEPSSEVQVSSQSHGKPLDANTAPVRKACQEDELSGQDCSPALPSVDAFHSSSNTGLHDSHDDKANDRGMSFFPPYNYKQGLRAS